MTGSPNSLLQPLDDHVLSFRVHRQRGSVDLLHSGIHSTCESPLRPAMVNSNPPGAHSKAYLGKLVSTTHGSITFKSSQRLIEELQYRDHEFQILLRFHMFNLSFKLSSDERHTSARMDGRAGKVSEVSLFITLPSTVKCHPAGHRIASRTGSTCDSHVNCAYRPKPSSIADRSFTSPFRSLQWPSPPSLSSHHPSPPT